MQPTLQPGDTRFLQRYVMFVRDPKRGELFVFRDPGHRDFAVKRVIAGPGDRVKISNGQVTVNGKLIDEPYLSKGTRTSLTDGESLVFALGPDEFFPLGDNRNLSEDGRYYGPIKRSSIIGVMK